MKKCHHPLRLVVAVAVVAMVSPRTLVGASATASLESDVDKLFAKWNASTPVAPSASASVASRC